MKLSAARICSKLERYTADVVGFTFLLPYLILTRQTVTPDISLGVTPTVLHRIVFKTIHYRRGFPWGKKEYRRGNFLIQLKRPHPAIPYGIKTKIHIVLLKVTWVAKICKEVCCCLIYVMESLKRQLQVCKENYTMMRVKMHITCPQVHLLVAWLCQRQLQGRRARSVWNRWEMVTEF